MAKYGLDDIFKESFRDFKANFWTVVKIGFFLSFLAALPFAIGAAGLDTYLPEDFTQLGGAGTAWIVIFILSLIVYMIFSLVMYAAMSVIALKRGTGARKAFGESWKYFWRFVGIGVLVSLVMIGLLVPGGLSLWLTIASWSAVGLGAKVALVILTVVIFLAGIVYMVYLSVGWMYAYLIVVNEGAGTVESMRKSRQYIRGKWWYSFGSMLLVGIIVGFAYLIVLMIPAVLIQIPIGLGMMALGKGTAGYFALSLVQSVVSQVFNFIYTVTGGVFTVYFLKNLYLALKGKKL